MQQILLLGAGKSATVLIDFLLEEAKTSNWQIVVGDVNLEMANAKVDQHPNGKAVLIDIFDEDLLSATIAEADLVISMVPARFHINVATICLNLGKNLITPSYISNEIKALDAEVKAKGLLFLNELGVDPGIDHMSAMKILDDLRAKGAKITGFESFTGGLVAPESDNNPWHYKFTWNPRNVVLAGFGPGGIKFLHNQQYKYIPYHKLFSRTEIINIDGYGEFEGYANRDSLKYIDLYGLNDVETMYRGTLRRPGFCSAWNILVQIGATADDYEMENVKGMSYRAFTNSFLKYRKQDSVELKLAHYLNLFDLECKEMQLLEWLGLFDEEQKITIEKGTPAQILQHILVQKWSMEPNDKDMLVMWHKFNYNLDGKQHELHSSMVKIGDNQEDTAMAQTVGLPIGIAAKQILNGDIKIKGVHLPIQPEIYNPILLELEKHGIHFVEKQIN